MSTITITIVEPDTENNMPRVLRALDVAIKGRNIKPCDLDAVDTCLDAVAVEVAQSVAATDLRLDPLTFYFGCEAL